MTNREKMNTLFDLYNKELIDEVALAEAIKALNGDVKSERDIQIEKNREQAQATRERLQEYQRNSYLNEQAKINDADLKNKIDFLKTITNNNGEAIYLGLEEDYANLMAKQEANPNDKEVNDSYWKLVNEVNELYDAFNKPQEVVAPEPVMINEQNTVEPTVGVPETVIPEIKDEEVSNDNVEPVQEPVGQTEEIKPANHELVPEQQQETENSVIQDDGLKEAIATVGMTQQNYELPNEAITVKADNIEEDLQKHGVSEEAQTENVVIQDDDLKKGKEEFEQNNEYISQTTPEGRNSVSSIKEALNSFKDKVNLNKDAAIGFVKAVAVGAAAAVALLTSGPVAGAILAGGLKLAAPATTTVLGAGAVHEFNKGRGGK